MVCTIATGLLSRSAGMEGLSEVSRARDSSAPLPTGHPQALENLGSSCRDLNPHGPAHVVRAVQSFRTEATDIKWVRRWESNPAGILTSVGVVTAKSADPAYSGCPAGQ